MAPRTPPEFHGKTYGDALEHALELRAWGQACEADKAGMRVAVRRGPVEK